MIKTATGPARNNIAGQVLARTLDFDTPALAITRSPALHASNVSTNGISQIE